MRKEIEEYIKQLKKARSIYNKKASECLRNHLFPSYIASYNYWLGCINDLTEILNKNED